MADLIDPVDIGHTWGGDLALSGTGDLLRVNLVERSKERVLRRLLTNPGDYASHVDYGAGLPQMVGLAVDTTKTAALITGQMLREASVVQSPAPTVTVGAITNGIAVSIRYLVAPDRTPAVLSFNVES